jgi:hypothetical protein
MKLEPLQQWICDTCCGLIERPEHGWLQWLSDEDGKCYGFRIVHHMSASPRKGYSSRGCYGLHPSQAREDIDLSQFVGQDGLAQLLRFFVHAGELDPEDGQPRLKSGKEFAELVRRLMIPHYEEARQYWESAKEDGLFEDAAQLYPYSSRTTATDREPQT